MRNREHLTLQKGAWSSYEASPQTPKEEEVAVDQSPRPSVRTGGGFQTAGGFYVEFDVSECRFQYSSSSVLRDI